MDGMAPQDISKKGSKTRAKEKRPMRMSEILNFPFPPDMVVWHAARKLIRDEDKVVMRNFGTCASQDPAIVIEFLRAANSLDLAPKEGQFTTTVHEAALRLGTELSIDALSRVSCRREFKNPEVAEFFEKHRCRGKRASIVARCLSEVALPQLCDDCRTAASLISIGDMLAVAVFQEDYVELARTAGRAAVNYRLAQNHRFDPDSMGLRYLENAGIPKVLIMTLDRDAEIEAPARAVSRTVCFAAAEMIDAFDAERWDRVQPGRVLPPKSALRTLCISEKSYRTVYERVSEYLGALKCGPGGAPPSKRGENQDAATKESGAAAAGDPFGDASWLDEGLENTPALSEGSEIKAEQPACVGERPPVLEIACEFAAAEEPLPPELWVPEPITPPGSVSCQESPPPIQIVKPKPESFGGLLQSILDSLAAGPFEGCALLSVDPEGATGMVLAARGSGIQPGQRLALGDALSPLALSVAKVPEISSGEAPSPFDGRNFTVAVLEGVPIFNSAGEARDMALYAECGTAAEIGFEGRRIFRNALKQLNERPASMSSLMTVREIVKCCGQR
jgi:HD-like signal output (HDOD) protein